MANNRMYLVHAPSGLGVYLGKRMGWGWYGVPDDLTDALGYLYKQCAIDNQDDFRLVMEDESGLASKSAVDWLELRKLPNGLYEFTWLSPAPPSTEPKEG